MKSTTKFVLSALSCLLLTNAHADSAYQWGPWMAQEDIERAILAGADPTELTDPTAAGTASPALPQLVATASVDLPRPDVPKAPTLVLTDGPIHATVTWSGVANIDLSMKAPGGGSVAYTTSTLSLSGGAVAQLTQNNGGRNDPVSPSGLRVEQIKVEGGVLPVGNYTFTVRNADDYRTKLATETSLALTGDGNRTSALYTDSLLKHQTASHSVTLDGSGVPVYSK